MTTTSEANDRKCEVVETAQELLRRGLVEGTSGNLSARLPDGNVVLTPSSLAYESMTIDDLVEFAHFVERDNVADRVAGRIDDDQRCALGREVAAERLHVDALGIDVDVIELDRCTGQLRAMRTNN